MNTGLAIVWLVLKATLFALILIASLLFVAALLGFTWLTQLLVFLIENWIVQTLIGAWVVFKAQNAVAAANRSMARLESSYHRKISSIRELYALIEKRIYASRRYLAVIDNEPDMIKKERDHYRVIVAEWNETAKIHQVNILLDFDPYFGLELDYVFFPEFSALDRKLQKKRLQAEKGMPTKIEETGEITENLNRLSNIAFQLTREMTKSADRVRKVLDGETEINLGNADLIGYRKILKALFVPSVQ